MKPFDQIVDGESLMDWNIVDFAISIANYSAQELADLKGMLGTCMMEVQGWNNAFTGEFLLKMKEEKFDADDKEHVRMLSNILTANVMADDITNKIKFTEYYAYLKIPECFKENLDIKH